jgi:hypothetical protein
LPQSEVAGGSSVKWEEFYLLEWPLNFGNGIEKGAVFQLRNEVLSWIWIEGSKAESRFPNQKEQL